jgi:hypothetical protein
MMNPSSTEGEKCAHTHSHCHCICHMMKGLFIILIGLTVLLGNLEVLSAKVTGIIWPIFLILAGIKLSIMRGCCKCCEMAKHE